MDGASERESDARIWTTRCVWWHHSRSHNVLVYIAYLSAFNSRHTTSSHSLTQSASSNKSNWNRNRKNAHGSLHYSISMASNVCWCTYSWTWSVMIILFNCRMRRLVKFKYSTERRRKKAQPIDTCLWPLRWQIGSAFMQANVQQSIACRCQKWLI